MKTLICAFTLFGMLNSFAGEITNPKTGEAINLKLNTKNQTLEVSDNLGNVKVVQLKQVDLKEGLKSDIDLCGANTYMSNHVYEESGPNYKTEDYLFSLLVPIYNVPRVAAVAYDTLLFPFKGSVKLVQNMKAKKDFKVLQNVINGDDKVEVSEGRFDRIKELLFNS